MRLTRKLLHDASTRNDGWTRAQLESLGISWPPQKGWLAGLVGKEITDEQYAEFVRLNAVRARKPKAEFDPTDAARQFLDGKTIRDICKQFKVPASTVEDAIRAFAQVPHAA